MTRLAPAWWAAALSAGLLVAGCQDPSDAPQPSEPATPSSPAQLLIRIDRGFKSPINRMTDEAVPLLAAYDDGTVILAGQSPTAKVSAKTSPDVIKRAARAVGTELNRKRPLGQECQILDNMVVEVRVPAVSGESSMLDEVPGPSCDKSDPQGRPDLLAAIASAQRDMLGGLGPRTPYLDHPQVWLTPGERPFSVPTGPVTAQWPLSAPFVDSSFHRNCIPLDRNDFDKLIAATGPSEPITDYLVRTGAGRPFPPTVSMSLTAALPHEQPCGGTPLSRTVPPSEDPIDPNVWAPLGPVDEVGAADMFATWNMANDATKAIRSRYGNIASFGGYGTTYRAARVGPTWYLDGYQGLGIGRAWWLVRTDPATGEILTVVAAPEK